MRSSQQTSSRTIPERLHEQVHSGHKRREMSAPRHSGEAPKVGVGALDPLARHAGGGSSRKGAIVGST